jgi:hypothetical protein
VRTLLDWDGGCPPVGSCRGIDEATSCGELPGLFATTPVPPYFPNGLSEYTCHTFPDDDRSVDSFIVALIALAIALPVTLFIAGCFSVANDSECPESWLQWAGLARLLLGGDANRRWHYTRGKPPRRFVRWYCRSVEAPLSETAANLLRSARAWATGTRPPWIVEAEEEAERVAHGAAAAPEDDVLSTREEDRALEAASADDAPGTHPMGHAPDDDECGDGDEHEAAELTRYKHRLTALGVVFVYLVWCVQRSHVPPAAPCCR